MLRLRQVMIDSMALSDPSTAWHAESLPVLRGRLAEPDGAFVAFVVDHPEQPGTLAALVAGSLEYRIGGARDPHGTDGYVFSVATDPDARRRGYARACMEALLEWFPRARRPAGPPHRVPAGRAAVRRDGLQAQAGPLAGADALSA